MSRRSFGVGVVIILGIVLRFLLPLDGVAGYPPGYSYTKFSGPVSGPDHEIIVKGKHGEPAIDYVAKPDYHFEYGVKDEKSKVSQSRKEARQGDEVIGEYSLVEPDGSVRTVKYRADKENGFQAQVYMNGKLVEHGNTASGSDESDEGYQVTHNILGSHSMEHPTIRSNSYGGSSSNSVSESRSNSLGRSSSEEGLRSSLEDDEGDDDSTDEVDDETRIKETESWA